MADVRDGYTLTRQLRRLRSGSLRVGFVPNREVTPEMTTRALLPAALLLTLTALLSCNRQRTQPKSEPAFLYAPVSEDVVGFTSDLDRLVPRLLAGYGVPGAALALVHHG